MTFSTSAALHLTGADLRDEAPLVLDLNGTLRHSDMLWAALPMRLKTHFWQAWRLPFWLLLDKVVSMRQLAR